MAGALGEGQDDASLNKYCLGENLCDLASELPAIPHAIIDIAVKKPARIAPPRTARCTVSPAHGAAALAEQGIVHLSMGFSHQLQTQAKRCLRRWSDLHHHAPDKGNTYNQTSQHGFSLDSFTQHARPALFFARHCLATQMNGQ
jgi:hypothetical protein